LVKSNGPAAGSPFDQSKAGPTAHTLKLGSQKEWLFDILYVEHNIYDTKETIYKRSILNIKVSVDSEIFKTSSLRHIFQRIS